MTGNKLIEILRINGVITKTPVDLNSVLNQLSPKLKVDPSMESPKIGEIDLDSGVIRYAPQDFTANERFLIAHMIGHWYYADQSVYNGFVETQKTINFRESYWQSDEFYANQFAISLLIPVFLVVEEWKRIVVSSEKVNYELIVNEMARSFDVSREHMKRRLKNIGVTY